MWPRYITPKHVIRKCIIEPFDDMIDLTRHAMASPDMQQRVYMAATKGQTVCPTCHLKALDRQDHVTWQTDKDAAKDEACSAQGVCHGKVPVGLLQHRDTVRTGTLVVTVLGCLYLTHVMFQSTLS